MKKLVIASIAVNILLVFLAFDDLLSLHDIKADYVSKSADLPMKPGGPAPDASLGLPGVKAWAPAARQDSFEGSPAPPATTS